MSKTLVLALLLAASPAVAQAPGSGAPVRVPGISAAGNAALDKLKGKTDPAGVALVQQQRTMQAQMAQVLNAPTLDLDRLAALMKNARDLEGQMRGVADRHVVEMLRALPVTDRKPFLRAITSRQAPPPAK